MARIRSIHPGLFTDEAFMTASPMARILLIGLWTEAWDDGVFEWKPIVIKARLFPADACDVAALLDELSSLNVIKRVERNSKPWGFIRNFRKFQRPKKPNNSGVSTAGDADFLGPEHVSSEPVPNQFPTSSGIPPQMEDGGWREGEKKEDKSSLRSDSAPARPKASKGSRLASGWQPSEAERQQAAAMGVPSGEIDRIAGRFRDYWTAKPGKDGVKLDWSATWRNWCDRECERRGWAPTCATAARDGPQSIYITPESDIDAWIAWTEHRGGKPLPTDRNGGWFVKSLFPPEAETQH
jgi:hypothetical protein